jgi:transcription termination factor NusB
MNRKKKNKTQRKIDYLYQVAMNNQTTIKVLSDFFYNYLEMKGDKDKYETYMKEKVDGILGKGKEGTGEVSGKSVQEEKKKKEK